MVVTPGSDKKANKKGKGTPNKMGTPVTGKDHSTPGSQKKTPTTPQSQNAATPKSVKQETPQSTKQKPAAQQSVQFTTPKSPKNAKTPQSQKPTKPDTPHPQKAITPQSQKQKKQAKPTTPGGTQSPGAGTPGLKDDKAAAKKRKTMSSDEDEFDSAEEDFEALLGNKKPKTEDDAAAKKLKPSASPVTHSPAAKVATPGSLDKKPVVGVPTSGTPTAVTTGNKKRALVDDTVPTEATEPVKKFKLTTTVANSKFTGLTEADVATDLKRQETLDRSLLYISKIPSNITETQLKALHPGILHVDLVRPRWGNTQKKQQLYAHIELRNEKAADEAYKLLSGRKFGDREITVDYVGSKSERQTKLKSVKAEELDPCKLFVRHFPQDTTADELKSLFPTADKVELLLKKDGKPLGFAFIHYSNPSVCYSAHSAAEHLTIRQHSLGVVFGRKLTSSQQKAERKKKATESNGQKQLTASVNTQQVAKGQQQVAKQQVKGQKAAAAGKQAAKKVKLELDDKQEDEDDDESDEDEDDSEDEDAESDEDN